MDCQKRLRDLPEAQRPRERIRREGPRHLSPEELVAAILGKGTRKRDVLQLACEVVRHYRIGLYRWRRTVPSVEEVRRALGVGEATAVQIVALLELSFRIHQEGQQVILQTPEDVVRYVDPMKWMEKEELRGLYLNTRRELVRDEVISLGTVNESLAHPREILRPALLSSAVSFILVHNHPSGDPRPSREDLALTRRVAHLAREMDIPLDDHVVVARQGYVSMARDYPELFPGKSTPPSARR